VVAITICGVITGPLRSTGLRATPGSEKSSTGATTAAMISIPGRVSSGCRSTIPSTTPAITDTISAPKKRRVPPTMPSPIEPRLADANIAPAIATKVPSTISTIIGPMPLGHAGPTERP
jgi:hypothetical protein